MSAISQATPSHPEQVRMDLYIEEEKIKAEKLPSEEERAGQRLFIDKQKKQLEKESGALWASGKECEAIAVQIDLLFALSHLEAKEHAATLQATASRRKIEQVERGSLASKIFEALEFVAYAKHGYPLGSSLASGEVQQSSDPRDALIDDVQWKWKNGHATHIRLEKRGECGEKIEQFKNDLKRAKQDHDVKGLSREVSERLLQQRALIYMENLESAYPRRSAAEERIDLTVLSMQVDLERAPLEKKAICKGKIQEMKQELEYFKENLEVLGKDTAAIEYAIREKEKAYKSEFEQQCVKSS